jgi:hypothetical protein
MTGASVGELIARSIDLYRRNTGMVLAMTLPVILVVTVLTALGLGELGARYHAVDSTRNLYIETAVAQLVTAPLISSVLARWVASKLAGDRVPSATELLAASLEAFPAVLFVIVLFWLGVFAGLSLLIVPGIFVAVSWYFVVQAVVLDGDRGLASVSRSAGLVRGRWWRSAATGIAFWLVAYLVQTAVLVVFSSIARSVDADAVMTVGTIVAYAITLPFLAIGATLYYLQLRAELGSGSDRAAR